MLPAAALSQLAIVQLDSCGMRPFLCRCVQGHFQIMFNPSVCPLLQRKLGLGWRILYCSGVWSYVVGAISTPFFIALPIITIWIGVFPIVISRELALGLTIYGSANYLLLYYVRSIRCALLLLGCRVTTAAVDCLQIMTKH